MTHMRICLPSMFHVLCLPRAPLLVHYHPTSCTMYVHTHTTPERPEHHPLKPFPLYSTRQVNAAFLPSARVASKAEMVLKRFYERAEERGGTRAADGVAPSSCVPIAIHWRGQARRRPPLTLVLTNTIANYYPTQAVT